MYNQYLIKNGIVKTICHVNAMQSKHVGVLSHNFIVMNLKKVLQMKIEN